MPLCSKSQSLILTGFNDELEKTAFIAAAIKGVGALKTVGKGLWGAGKSILSGNASNAGRYMNVAGSAAKRLPGAGMVSSGANWMKNNPRKAMFGAGAGTTALVGGTMGSTPRPPQNVKPYWQ